MIRQSSSHTTVRTVRYTAVRTSFLYLVPTLGEEIQTLLCEPSPVHRPVDCLCLHRLPMGGHLGYTPTLTNPVRRYTVLWTSMLRRTQALQIDEPRMRLLPLLEEILPDPAGYPLIQ